MDSKKRSSLAKTSLPSVGSSIDDFLARVSDQEQAVDLSGFDPAQREAALHDHINLLKAQLDEAKLELKQTRARLDEARAAIVHAPRTQSRWGVVAAAFVIGGGIVFAVITLLPRWTSTPTSTPAAQSAIASEPPAAKPAITVQPIEPAAETKPVAAPPLPPPIEAPAAAPEPPPVETKPVATKPARLVKHTAPPPHTPAAAHDDKKPGDSGLYNPF